MKNNPDKPREQPVNSTNYYCCASIMQLLPLQINKHCAFTASLLLAPSGAINTCHHQQVRAF